ncbi:SDR family NAD(P)-dependent oxidoreductase [Streptomyces sp. NPDC059385]|uniref:SDR family NAD(P)-dependent oxidoreductase n=1 Tax=Streptomyces sp. NPDC059385 TaxID=3346817 RepID=UPI0036AF53D4
MNLDLFTAVRVTREVLPLMLDRGSRSIVNVCSVNAVFPDPMVIDCSAAKAVLAFSKGVSKEVGGRGIRVNAVSPGPVETDLWPAGGRRRGRHRVPGDRDDVGGGEGPGRGCHGHQPVFEARRGRGRGADAGE